MALPQSITLLVGLGGAGKTSLIHALGMPGADPRIRTPQFKVYKGELWHNQPTWYGTKHIDRCNLYIADYNGQRFDQLFGEMMQLQAVPNSPYKYGSVNAMIFIADIFPAPIMSDEKPKTDEEAINKQLKKTLDFWTIPSIDALFGLTTSSLRYVCFFVNKCDLLGKPMTDDLKATILKRYITIRSHINNYSEGRLIKSIVGSAQNKDGVPELYDDLIRTAQSAR